MRARRPLLLLLTAALAGLALALALLLGDSSRPTAGGPREPAGGIGSVSGFAGAALPAPAPAHDFTLTDQTGRAVSLRSFRGQVVVLAFLSSACGPTCTLIAQQIRGALDELGRPVPVLLISVDPAADRRPGVRRFLSDVSLNGRARFLDGAPAVLRPVWRAYRVMPLSAGPAAFERSAQVALIDRSGQERVIYGLEQLTPEGLAHDIRKLS